MKIIILIVAGIAGGIIGGMGMGGGTLLIPLLTVFGGMGQHISQSINLIAFIPMSAVALFFHFKNRLIKLRYAVVTSVPAVFTGIVFAFLAKKITAESLSVYFGIFLIALGIYQLAGIIIGGIRKKMKRKKTGCEIKESPVL